ncbi:MAG: tetratricopeptide repeat protein, partial [Actinomycetota bacterium]|nr:tetratricopeptide repeat protein [Actinomycetota bacterium]
MLAESSSGYFDLGEYRRDTSGSGWAEEWFNRGLIWTYGFNHEEAVRCFEEAARLEPGFALAHWGIA